MGKIPCLDCNEPFEIPAGVALDTSVSCDACGSNFVIIAVEPLEIEWSYDDYSDYDYDEDEWDEDEDEEFDDEWDAEEWSNELWNEQFAKNKKRVTQQDKELSAAKKGQTQPRIQNA